jgi:purine nucleoside permease
MVYPHVHCTPSREICQLTTGEGEINAAASITALILSSSALNTQARFDLRKTYFLIAGIAGVNPRHATLGSVALARYAVQVALQHEFDAREALPEGFGTTGYVAFGTKKPYEYPPVLYGTEVMEVNAGLRDVVFEFARRAELVDSQDAVAYRGRYGVKGEGNASASHDEHQFAAAVGPPAVVRCDAATSDVYYSGTLLSEAFEKVTEVWTNGTGRYCMTAQEDNATLEVLVRMAVHGLVDFGRVIIMRTGESFS